MLQNLTNFFNLIRTRKIKTTLADNDLIAVGTRDNTWSGNYQPTAITFEDLQNQIGTLSVTTTGTGGASTFVGGVLNIPVYQTQIPHLEWDDSQKTIWNNGLGNHPSNTAFGDGVLKSRTTGNSNTGFGYLALWNTTTGQSNNAFGSSALQSNTTGFNNVAIGTSALVNNTTGYRNVAIGVAAMLGGTNSQENVAIGHAALSSGNSGFGNVAVGAAALSFNTFGGANIAIGRNSLQFNTTGISNTVVGNSALPGSTGSNNVAIGEQAMFNNNTGSDNTAVGRGVSCANFSGCVILGRDAIATANNQFVVGSVFTNAGTITTETITPDRTWTVRINGANYKIPLLAI